MDNYEQRNKYTTWLFAFPLPGKITFPLKKSPLFVLLSQLPGAALKQYSNGIPRSALIPTMPVWDGTYNEDGAQLFLLSSIFIVCFVSTCTYFSPVVSFHLFVIFLNVFFSLKKEEKIRAVEIFHIAVCSPVWREDFL